MADLLSVTDSNFNAEVLDSATPVLVDFWADWCRPCHIVEPHVKAIASENAGSLKVVKLNIDENPSIAEKYGVFSIPSLLLFIDGQERERIVGAYPKERLLVQLKPHLTSSGNGATQPSQPSVPHQHTHDGHHGSQSPEPEQANQQAERA